MSVTILVTRPAHQADDLCVAIEAEGGVAVRFPTVEIVSREPYPLDQYDIVIFISANAVHCGLSTVLPGTVIAMGPATQAALADQGVTALIPKAPYNTERLLELPELQNISGKRTAIVAGVGGRNALQPELEQRGATVDKLDVYERALPNSDLGVLEDFWAADHKLILCTSVSAVENLITLVDHPQLLTTPLLVISERIARSDAAQRFTSVHVCQSVARQDILQEAKAVIKP